MQAEREGLTWSFSPLRSDKLAVGYSRRAYAKRWPWGKSHLTARAKEANRVSQQKAELNCRCSSWFYYSESIQPSPIFLFNTILTHSNQSACFRQSLYCAYTRVWGQSERCKLWATASDSRWAPLEPMRCNETFAGTFRREKVSLFH